MLATIYTDASFYLHRNIGSYAFWARSDAGKVAKSGAFKRRVNNSQEAEMLCIANAIHAVLQVWPQTTVLFINTDSQYCINVLYKNAKFRSDLIAEAVDLIRVQLTQRPELTLRMRHVKGHQRADKNIRAWLNNWCDEEARKAAILAH